MKKRPCETCAKKHLAPSGACNGGLGICAACMDFYEKRGEQLRAELDRKAAKK